MAFSVRWRRVPRPILFTALVVLLVHAVPAFARPYTRGGTGSFAVFGEGTDLNGTMSPAAVTLTNIGIGHTGKIQLSGTGNVAGNLNFSTANTGQLEGAVA